MKQIAIKDHRGHVLAFVGTGEEFGSQQDAARALALQSHEKMAWIDWVESTAPGNGSSLMDECLRALEAEGVALIGLEVVPEDPDAIESTVRFYERFGFVNVSLIAPLSEFPIMFRDAGWNGVE